MGSAVSVESAARIPHLGDRPAGLESQGWKGRDAEWIALVCLHSGVFIRSQYAAFIETEDPRRIFWDFLGPLVEREAATKVAWGDLGLGPAPGGKPQVGVWQVRKREIYRALGVEHIRHRREAAPAVLLRRLLSLDYVVDHLDMPWLPTEHEKVEAFESLGIDRSVLPRRVYRGRAGNGLARFFPDKHRIALGAGLATFVYADADEATAKGLGSWGNDYRLLWSALRERAIAVAVVVVSRMHKWLTRAERVLARWQRGGGTAAAAVAERRRLEEVIRHGDASELEAYGGLNGALARLSELDDAPAAEGGGWIDTGATWFSRRLCAS